MEEQFKISDRRIRIETVCDPQVDTPPNTFVIRPSKHMNRKICRVCVKECTSSYNLLSDVSDGKTVMDVVAEVFSFNVSRLLKIFSGV